MASPLEESRARVILSSRGGLTLSFQILTCGMYLFPAGKETEFPTNLEKLVFTLKWQSLSVMMLLFGIGAVGRVRATTTAIDPVYGKGEQLLVEARYLQNTLEQLVLSSTGQLILSVYVSAAVLTRIIPVLVILFVVGRFLLYN